MSKCAVCSTKKSTLECGLCHSEICKNCTEFITDDTFHFADHKPIQFDLSSTYCLNCYTTDVIPEIEKYESMLNLAKDVRIFDKTQGKETRLIKRLEPPITVEHCLDQQDATMKMAFIAAKLNFNSIIDVDIKTIKIRNGSYQTSECTGWGIPCNVSDAKLIKDKTIRSDPN